MSEGVPELEVPYELRQLIAGHLESMEQVEVIVLLARGAQHAWSAAAVAETLRWSPRITQQTLEYLTRTPLVRRVGSGAGGGTYEYAARGADLDAVQSLLRLYDTRPLLLGRLIYDRPSTVARSFADAFRIRQKRGK